MCDVKPVERACEPICPAIRPTNRDVETGKSTDENEGLKLKAVNNRRSRSVHTSQANKKMVEKMRKKEEQRMSNETLETPKPAKPSSSLRPKPKLALIFCLFTCLIVAISVYANAESDPYDLTQLYMPEFSPTRKPQATIQETQTQSKPQFSQNKLKQQEPTKQKSSHLQLKQNVIEQAESKREKEEQQVSSDSSTPIERNKPLKSQMSLSLNELDIFLDDMNHRELSEVASGHPISDLFKPKSLAPAQMGTSGRAQIQPDAVLDGSHSERQIYTECALILQRTYVKNINDPKHQLVPFGKTEQSCISYKDIDKAILQAKKELKFKEFTKKLRKHTNSARNPIEEIHYTLEPPEELIAALGELNMLTTQILADKFELSNDELLNGLPLIDMSKTKFWPSCPLLVRQDLKCQPTRFRTLTGHCNNLKHPTWGAAMTPFARYLPPVHPDGIWAPRKSIVSEITFQLSPGHHELHSQISQSERAPVYNVPSSMRRLDEFKETDTETEHEPSQSVQFARHARPDSKPENEQGDRRIKTKFPERSAASSTHLETASTTSHGHRAKSVSSELPSARLITSIVHKDYDLVNHDFSILFMSWGQLLDHDMTRAAQPPASIKCCPSSGEDEESPGSGQNLHKLCMPIQVPPNDPFYSRFQVNCLEFRRSLAGLRSNCVLGPRVHQNAITSPIDANFVYGSSQAVADSLRLFKGGRLRARDWFSREHLKPLLPAQEDDPDRDCLGRPSDLFCFLAGDVRVNEQTHLTVLHTLYMREHNRICERLEEINPHWDDERLYQEARHIVAAGVQHVMLNEYISLLIGPKMAELYNLTSHESSHYDDGRRPVSGAHWSGYNPTVTTSVANSFAAAAFRQGHTFIQGTVERYSKFHQLIGSERLRHLLKRPFLIYEPGVLDQLTAGMLNQPSQGYDPFISEDISGHLFQPPKAQFGHDLPAINLQRGREQGLPGYNLFREWCGLPRAETFEQLEPYLSNHTAYQYSRLYKHVDDIDLWSGGVSERKLPGAAIGPTFACIIARQFSNTRRGDRFWYENPGLPSSFTQQQLAQVRRISLAKILCANSDDLPTIQRWPLRMAHPVLNPRLPCNQIPEPNYKYWQEYTNFS